MTTLDLRNKLKRIIDSTQDRRLLESWEAFITEQSLGQEAVEDMVRMARLSDEDIAAGRTHSVEEVKRWMNEEKGKT
ncbi:MAG: hypothetical protein IPG10_03650 [Flavobacteriales bacterium]|jgi:hypothetical protein|nr:hypothetical protein [Flavobacteriales bacterium]MBK6755071.1 hypothetical protein [Flavobacteriales bacterium]MBK7085604.1 hypothetical protein [Flavobacteriales bacterium]MBK7268098.1 hypothetical protein [Flavobacteriales bacterium]MBK7751249.1 hypothetical protein [Flavobacteriales bacterium]